MPIPLPDQIETPTGINNPLILVYNALWTAAERNVNLTKWISPGSREKFDTRLGQKRNISTADTPELILMPQSFAGNFTSTSTTTDLFKTYTWLISSGDQRLNRVLNEVSWELFRAMADWKQTLCPLSWSGNTFVINCRFVDGADSEPGSDDESERGILGWIALYNIEVQMRFPTANLKLP